MDTINMEDEIQVDFLEDTIAAYENFIDFLQSDSATIDHNYLWDMATQNNPNLMKGGYNLVILEIQKDDMRDNMQILCPSHSQSNVLYDPTKETVILIMQTNKQGTYFEPVYVYSEDPDEIQYAFTEQTSPDNLKNMLSIIQKTTNHYCAPLPSMPKKYHFKKNKQAQDVLNVLKQYNYEVNVQVLNYQGNVIGFYVKSDEDHIYVPCYPSSELPLLEKWWMDDDDLWHSYEETRNRLVSIHQKTEGKILCSPKFKVLEDGMIVGILTETNQFVQISPVSENIFQDGLFELDGHNYLIADKIITTTQSQDTKRMEIVRKIELETQYYALFRTIIRQNLHEYKNKNIRKEIIQIIDRNNRSLTSREKLQNIEAQLKKLIHAKIQFSEIDPAIIGELMKCTGQDCLTVLANNQTVFPGKHLLSGVNNEAVYYGRVADELLRYRRVQLFMLNPDSYLNIGYSEYVIFNTEMLMLQSLLTPDYFADLVLFNESDFLKQVDYNNAVPALSQSYSNQPITLDEQMRIVSIEKKPGELNIDCVQKIRDEVQGNERSMWKRIFPKPTREVVFHATPYCSFYMMIYIIENVTKARKGKTNVNLTVSNIKSVLWGAYKEYLDKETENYAKIESILKMQGKRKLFSGNSTLEQIIASEGYFLSDLDIWVIATKLRLPIVLFSSTALKSLMDPTVKIDWLLMGGTNIQKDKYFFVRSPSNSMEYQMVIPPAELTNPNLNEFYGAVQKSIVEGKKSLNVKDLQQYLDEYKYKTIVLKK
jgi:hypothetical protein